RSACSSRTSTGRRSSGRTRPSSSSSGSTPPRSSTAPLRTRGATPPRGPSPRPARPRAASCAAPTASGCRSRSRASRFRTRSAVEFAREPAEPEADLSLSELVRQTTSLARHGVLGRDVELVERYADEQLAVSGSAAELKQAILNLLTNAQQAMPQGGTVTLE